MTTIGTYLRREADEAHARRIQRRHAREYFYRRGLQAIGTVLAFIFGGLLYAVLIGGCSDEPAPYRDPDSWEPGISWAPDDDTTWDEIEMQPEVYDTIFVRKECEPSTAMALAPRDAALYRAGCANGWTAALDIVEEIIKSRFGSRLQPSEVKQ